MVFDFTEGLNGSDCINCNLHLLITAFVHVCVVLEPPLKARALEEDEEVGYACMCMYIKKILQCSFPFHFDSILSKLIFQ